MRRWLKSLDLLHRSADRHHTVVLCMGIRQKVWTHVRQPYAWASDLLLTPCIVMPNHATSSCNNGTVLDRLSRFWPVLQCFKEFSACTDLASVMLAAAPATCTHAQVLSSRSSLSLVCSKVTLGSSRPCQNPACFHSTPSICCLFTHAGTCNSGAALLDEPSSPPRHTLLPVQYGLPSYLNAQPPPPAAAAASSPQVPTRKQTHPFNPAEAASRSVLPSQHPAGLHAPGFSTDVQMELCPLGQDQPEGVRLGDARAPIPLVHASGVLFEGQPEGQPGGQLAPTLADQNHIPFSALTAQALAVLDEGASSSTSSHTQSQSGVTHGYAALTHQQQQLSGPSIVDPRLYFHNGAQGRGGSSNRNGHTPVSTAPSHSNLGSAWVPITAPTPGGGSSVYQFQGINSTSGMWSGGDTSQLHPAYKSRAAAQWTSSPATRRLTQRYQDMQSAEAARNRAALEERASIVQGDPRWAHPSVSTLQQQAGAGLYGGNDNDEWDSDLQAALAASVVQFQQEQAGKGASKSALGGAASVSTGKPFRLCLKAYSMHVNIYTSFLGLSLDVMPAC